MNFYKGGSVSASPTQSAGYASEAYNKIVKNCLPDGFYSFESLEGKAPPCFFCPSLFYKKAFHLALRRKAFLWQFKNKGETGIRGFVFL